MTNTFIPTLGRQPLYCIWIDPQLRSFQFSDSEVERTSATRARTKERGVSSQRFLQEGFSRGEPPAVLKPASMG
jgi:hypothetical protein